MNESGEKGGNDEYQENSFGAVSRASAGFDGRARMRSWPERPIHWIVPYPPGGGTDLVARVLAAQLEKALGQPVVVDNRPGGSTVTGTAVARECRTRRLHRRHGVRFACDQFGAWREHVLQSANRFHADHQACQRAAGLHREHAASADEDVAGTGDLFESASGLVHLRLARPRQSARDRISLVQSDVENGRARRPV